jgi:hypothetical protein
MQLSSDPGSASYASRELFSLKDDGKYTESYRLDGLLENCSPQLPVRQPWHMRCCAKVRERAPNAYDKVERLLLYIRGPRPKVNLPGPPFLMAYAAE